MSSLLHFGTVEPLICISNSESCTKPAGAKTGQNGHERVLVQSLIVFCGASMKSLSLCLPAAFCRRDVHCPLKGLLLPHLGLFKALRGCLVTALVILFRQTVLLQLRLHDCVKARVTHVSCLQNYHIQSIISSADYYL